MSPAEPSSTLGIIEAAALLRMSPDALKRKAREGKVPGSKPGRQWVFIREDLLAHLRGLQEQRAQAGRQAAEIMTRLRKASQSAASMKLAAHRRQLSKGA
jgi:excisionase family DNA binding protein